MISNNSNFDRSQCNDNNSCFFLYLVMLINFFFQEIVDEIDEDESGLLEFPEFVQLAAKFLIEEDEEQMKWELKEAFRIYDKHGTEFFFL